MAKKKDDLDDLVEKAKVLAEATGRDEADILADLMDDGILNERWPDWLIQGKPRTSHRYTFSTYNYYKKDAPLVKSGLLGPVTIQESNY